MVKIMSLVQNMWERPLVRELRNIQARINELECRMRECWPNETLGVRELRDRYNTMDRYTSLISDAHIKRYELMDRIQEGRRHDE